MKEYDSNGTVGFWRFRLFSFNISFNLEERRDHVYRHVVIMFIIREITVQGRERLRSSKRPTYGHS